MLLEKIRYAKFNSYILRQCLSCWYKEGRDYRIPFGPLRGLKMHYDRTINYHAILGLWEKENFAVLSKVFVKSGLFGSAMTAYDVGADIGTYSLWCARTISRDGMVYAFEPSPQILPTLKKNIELNGFSNIGVIERACADRAGSAEFLVGAHHHTSGLHLSPHESASERTRMISVTTTTLDEFFCGSEPHQAPDIIKMDIEGGGVLALKGCAKSIDARRPFFIIESHDPGEDAAISAIVTSHEYDAFRITDHAWVKRSEATYPDPEGIWGSLLLCPHERFAQVARILDR